METCIENYIAKNLNCSPPWFANTDNNDNEICAGKSKFKEMMGLLKNFEYTTEKNLIEETGCLPQCKSENYGLQVKIDGFLPAEYTHAKKVMLHNKK